MKCPVCKDVKLVMSERQGVEIDYCPSCRGVWLDRGELDKIIEKSASFTSQNSYNQIDKMKHKNIQNQLIIMMYIIIHIIILIQKRKKRDFYQRYLILTFNVKYSFI